MTEEWVAFEYREFYDYPRAVVVDLASGRYLLECRFDDQLDDYPSAYRVVRLTVDEELAGSWSGLGSSGAILGTVQISPELFDATRRRLLRWDLVRRSIGD